MKILNFLIIFLITYSNTVFAISKNDFIPDKAFKYKETIRKEIEVYFPDLYNFNFIRILKSKCEAELEEYVETGRNGHFTITKQEALHIAGIYESLKFAEDKFTVQEINWFVKTIREFYFSN
jgi:hypothetical protein